MPKNATEMTPQAIIAPSILSMDYSRMQQQTKELNESNAKWLHFDVMDGHFVPALTFGPQILQGFDKTSDLVMDVHLMVDDPVRYFETFKNAGADQITFHTEALDNDLSRIEAALKTAHDLGLETGITVKPNTAIEPFAPVLDQCDLVLIMSVEPGKGGQAFMEDQLEKVRFLRNWRDKNNLNYLIEIDGGINQTTARLAKEAGVDALVAGSYIFKGDIKGAVDSLL